MKTRNLVGLWIFLSGWLHISCSFPPMMLRPTTPPPPTMNLGDQISWKIDVGPYVKGAKFGKPEMTLGEDLGPRLQRDLTAAWGLSKPENTVSKNTKWNATLRLERLDSIWGEWRNVENVEVRTTVRLGLEIALAGESPTVVYTNAIDAERVGKFNINISGTYEIYIDLLLDAYREAMLKLTSDQKLLVALGFATESPALASRASSPPTSGAKPSGSVIIAVFDIQDSSKKFSKDILDQLTEYLSTKLTESGTYKTLPQDQIRSRLKEEQKESYKECYDQSCQLELGKTLAAQKTLSTKLLRVGSKCAITSKLYDLKTETADRAASAETDCTESALMGGMEQIAQKLTAAGN